MTSEGVTGDCHRPGVFEKNRRDLSVEVYDVYAGWGGGEGVSIPCGGVYAHVTLGEAIAVPFSLRERVGIIFPVLLLTDSKTRLTCQR